MVWRHRRQPYGSQANQTGHRAAVPGLDRTRAPSRRSTWGPIAGDSLFQRVASALKNIACRSCDSKGLGWFEQAPRHQPAIATSTITSIIQRWIAIREFEMAARTLAHITDSHLGQKVQLSADSLIGKMHYLDEPDENRDNLKTVLN